ncbi:MAG: hypothetical protein KC766_31390 [Myxococcales bacterium]|nr:hypothetical protein [Myxococcales bacterium]
MRPRSPRLRWAGLLLAVGALPATLALRAAAPPKPPAALAEAAPPRQLGQWVWTTRDAQRFDEAHARDTALVPALLVGSVKREADQLRVTRGITPAATGARRVAAVIRLEDSVHPALSDQGPKAFAERLETLVNPLLLDVGKSGVELVELQLDYDVPVSKLGLWADTLKVLRKGPLGFVSLWITSIPSHLSDPDYGERLQGAVDGTILQLFDTGLDCNAANQRRLAAQLRRHGLPFRIGVGAFERARRATGKTLPAAATNHGCWLERSISFRSDPLYRGTWVFAANQDTDDVFRSLAAGGSRS